MCMQNDTQIENFCHNISYLRRLYGFSKQEMAKRLNIGVYSINLLEAGIMPPRLRVSVIYAVYQQFGLLPSVLLSGILDDTNFDLHD